MSSRFELAYLLVAGTTLLAIVVTGIWWSQRRRNHRLGSAASSFSASSPSSRARTPAEELRAARLRRLAQENRMAAPSNEQSSDGDGTDAKIKALTTTKASTAVGSTAELRTEPSEAGEDDRESSQSNEDRRTDETHVADIPATNKAKNEKANLAATGPPAVESVATKRAVKETIASSDSVFTVSRQVQSKPLSGSVMGTIDENGCPVSKPLKTLDEFFQWLPGSDALCVPTVPLRPRTRQDPKKPRTIVCHDMMGGYQMDRFVQGMQTVEDYHFYHWHLIDAFIYFSHNLVTIPPPSWTNSAHQHGVLSLGTFITEWKDGAKVCAHVFSSEANVNLAVDKLVMLAEYYQLDGWLVNIENPVAVSGLMHEVCT